MFLKRLRQSARRQTNSWGRRYVPSLEPLEDRRLLNAGALDPSFGTGGIVTGQFPDYTSTALDTAVLGNRDYLVLTGTQVLRLLPDGSPDPSFGAGGKVALDFNPAALAVQANGDFIVVGRTTANFTQPGQFEVERFTPDGALDTGFGTGGRVVTEFGSNDGAAAVALAPEGKIVVAGTTNFPTLPDIFNAHEDFAVERLNPDGSLDASFGTDGKVTIDFGNGADAAGSLVVQPDGKVIVLGTSIPTLFHPPEAIVLARLNPDGSLDGSFGAGGRVTTAPDPNGQSPAGLALQGDGKIVVAGRTTQPVSLLVRYNPDGTPDAGFGTNGVVTDSSLLAGGVALQPDGKIVVAGAALVAGGTDLAVARYLPDGRHDPAFGVGGVVTTDLGSPTVSASGVTIQQDSSGLKILAGATYSVSSTNRFALARYLASGDADPVAAFVTQVYQDLLSRDPEPGAVQAWGNVLGQGVSRTTMVQLLEASPEYLGREVDHLYQTLLGRPADPVGLAALVGALRNGATVQQAEGLLLGSTEYFQRAGGTAGGFLAALYRDVLGRAPDAAGEAAVAGALGQGASRTGIALTMLLSPEAALDRVQGYFLQFLGHPADAPGAGTLAGLLLQGMRDDQFVAALLASAEYQLRAEGD